MRALAVLVLLAWAIPVQAGPFVGEQPTYIREAGYEVRFAYKSGGNGDGQVEYQGWAQPNTSIDVAKWRIRRFTYDSSNRVTAIEWAGGTDNFNQIWSNRASLSY